MDSRNKRTFGQKAKRFLRRVALAPLAVFMGNGMTGMDSILNAEPAPPAGPQEPEPHEEPEPEPTGVPAEPAPPAEPEPAPEPEEVKGLKAAAAAERKKRQELEAEMEQLRQQLAQVPQPEEEEVYIDEDVKAHLTKADAKVAQALLEQKWELSEAITRDAHEDYEEKYSVFKEMVKTNPALYDQMCKQPLPAKWMYKTASDHLQVQKLREIGDPATFEATLREKMREEIRAELKAEQDAEKAAATEAAIRSKLPKGGFSEERSVGTARATTKHYTGPTPMGSILK